MLELNGGDTAGHVEREEGREEGRRGVQTTIKNSRLASMESNCWIGLVLEPLGMLDSVA